MRNIVVQMLLCVLLCHTCVGFAYSERKAALDKETLQTLLEIRDTVHNLTKDRGPRYDAPCYGVPGTPVPPQPAIDAAKIIDDICCCLKSLLADTNSIIDECCERTNSNIDITRETILDELSIIESIIDGQGGTIDCSAVELLTTCPLINNTNFSMIQWLKAIFYILNHKVNI